MFSCRTCDFYICEHCDVNKDRLSEELAEAEECTICLQRLGKTRDDDILVKMRDDQCPVVVEGNAVIVGGYLPTEAFFKYNGKLGTVIGSVVTERTRKKGPEAKFIKVMGRCGGHPARAVSLQPGVRARGYAARHLAVRSRISQVVHL